MQSNALDRLGRRRRNCVHKAHVTLTPCSCSPGGQRCFREAARGTVDRCGLTTLLENWSEAPVCLPSHFHYFFLSSSCNHDTGAWTSYFLWFLNQSGKIISPFLDFSLLVCNVLSDFSASRVEGTLGITWSSLSTAAKRPLLSLSQRSNQASTSTELGPQGRPALLKVFLIWSQVHPFLSDNPSNFQNHRNKRS